MATFTKCSSCGLRFEMGARPVDRDVEIPNTLSVVCEKCLMKFIELLPKRKEN